MTYIIGLSGQAYAGKTTVADFLVKNHGFVKVSFADPIKRAAMEWWDFSEEQLWGDLKEVPDKRYPLGFELACGCLTNKWHEANSGFWVELIIKHCSNEDHQGEWHRGKIIVGELPPERVYLTPRHAMQQIGTEVARAIDPDVWVRIGMRVAKKLLSGDFIYERTVGVKYVPTMKPINNRGVAFDDCRFENEFVAVKKEGKLVRIYRGQLSMSDEGDASVITDEHKQHRSETEQQQFNEDYFHYLLYNTGTLQFLEDISTRMMDVFKGNIRPYDEAQADIPPALRK